MKFPLESEVISTLGGFDRTPVIVKGFNPDTKIYTVLDGRRTYHLPEHTLRFYGEELPNPSEDIEARLKRYRELQEQKQAKPIQTERKRYNAFEQYR